MRLIDADSLIKHFEEIQKQEGAIGLDFVAIIDEIKEYPTAYNTDKVVEKLNDRSTLSRSVGWPKSYEIITLDDAIEIVKGGGIDG